MAMVSLPSSPDPLALSIDSEGIPINRSPLRDTSPNKRSPRKTSPNKYAPKSVGSVNTPSKSERAAMGQTGELYLQSPSRASGNNSPWRIRVTVEADEQAPSRGRSYKVPLKGENESTPAKRRTQPRISEGPIDFNDREDQTPKKRRVPTPARRTTRRRQSGFVQDIVPEPSHIGNDSSAKRKRGRPRKSDVAPTPRTTPTDEATLANHNTTQAPRDANALLNSAVRAGPIPAANREDESSVADEDASEDDQRTGLEDDTAVLDRSLSESEGFSMVSLDSLRSRGVQSATSQSARTQTSGTKAEARSTTHLPSPDLSNDSSELSHSTQNNDLQTTNESKGSNPSKTANRSNVEPQTRVTGVDEMTRFSRPQSGRTSAAADTTVFSGFGHGTQKQLQAGFMMGELLARGERGYVGPAVGKREVGKTPNKDDMAQGPESRSSAKPGRLPKPTNRIAAQASDAVTTSQSASSIHEKSDTNAPRERSSDEMSWRPTTIAQRNSAASHKYDEMSWQPSGHSGSAQSHDNAEKQQPSSLDDTSMTINSSPPIGTASGARSKNQAIRSAEAEDVEMRDVNNHVEDIFDDSDIWREEADRSLEDSLPLPRPRQRSSRQQNISDSISLSKSGSSAEEPGKTNKQQPSAAPQEPRRIVPFNKATPPSPIPSISDLLPEDNRPPRSKIPQTWRRISGGNLIYSDEAEEPLQPAKTQEKKQPFRSPGFMEGMSSVFRRYAQGSAHAQPEEEPTEMDTVQEEAEEEDRGHAQSSSSKAAPKGILSSPQRRASSPAKEVRWREDSDGEVSIAAQDARYFSSSSQSSSSQVECESDSGSDSDEANSLDGEEGATDADKSRVDQPWQSELDASDMRQLKNELRATTTPKKNPLSGTTAGHSPATNPSIPSSPPRSKKTYSPRDGAYGNAKPAATSTQPGFFSRLTSLLFAPSITTPIYPSQAVKPPPHTWTRNHYLLLAHYHRHVLCLARNTPTASAGQRLTYAITPPKGLGLPLAFSTPLSDIPDVYKCLIGVEMSSTPRCTPQIIPKSSLGKRKRLSLPFMGGTDEDTQPASPAPACPASCPGVPALCAGKRYARAVSERDVRLAWAFAVDAAEAGVPLSDADKDDQGHTRRAKEEWRQGESEAEEVLKRVFSLWVGSEIRKEAREAMSAREQA